MKLLCDNEVVMSTKNYSIQQLRLFYSMLYKCKLNDVRKLDGDEEMFINKNELAEIFGSISTVRVHQIIDNIPNTIYLKNKEYVGFISVFNWVQYNLSNDCIEFSVNKSFYDTYLVNLISNFTIIDIERFLMLRSMYGQRLYEIYRRFNGIGKFTLSVCDFKYMLQVPESYKSCHIDQKVIGVAIDDLSSVGINVKVIKNKVGKKITGYTFTYKIDNMK